MTSDKGGSAAEKKPENDVWQLPAVPEPVKYMWQDISKDGVRQMWLNILDGSEEYKLKGFMPEDVQDLITLCGSQFDEHGKKIDAGLKRDRVETMLEKMLLTYPLFREDGAIFVFQDGCYKLDKKYDSLKTAAKNTAEIFGMFVPRQRTNDAVQKAVWTLPPNQHKYDPDDEFIAFKNAYFSVEDKRMYPVHPHPQHQNIRAINHVTYDPDAKCPMFQKLLDTSLPDEIAKSRMLDVMAMALMTNKATIHTIAFLLGSGNNGKNMILNVLTALMGTNSCSNMPLERLDDPFFKENIFGKTANIDAESTVDKWSRKQTSIIKRLVSGEHDEIRRKGITDSHMKPHMTWIIGTNLEPEIPDQSPGMLRRIIRIDFDVEFDGTAKWPNKIAKNEKELSGVLNLLLPRIIRLKEKQKIEHPMDKADLRERMKTRADIAANWQEKYVDITDEESDVLPQKWAHKSYSQLAEELHTTPVSPTDFANMLRKSGWDRICEPKSTRVHGVVMKCWVGVKFKQGMELDITQQTLDPEVQESAK